MKILFGLHATTHKEIALAEINAFQQFGIQTATCLYGNWGAKGVLNGIKIVIKNALDLKRQAAIQKSDIVYLNTAFDFKTLVRDSITIFILRTYNKNLKIVLKLHGSEEKVVAKRSWTRNYVFKKANLFLVLSSEEKSNLINAGVEKEKVQITANPVDKNLYLTDNSFKQKNGINEHQTVLLFVGRFIKEKGILDLIEAAKLLKDSGFSDFQLLCLGTGPLYAEVAVLIEKYQLSENVLLLGHIPESETSYYYANCDVLILPTYHQEGFPMAVFQAVGAGRSVITTKIRAAADYFKEYENCIWVEKENPKQLFEKIVKLINDKNLREQLGNNNLHLADRFTNEKIVEGILPFLKKL